jgi:hypothetical protein
MDTHDARHTRMQTGRLTAAVIGAYIVYALTVGLRSNGRHFLELGVLRLVLLAALLEFARWSGARTGRLGRMGTGLVAVTAVAYVAGAVGGVVTDGWSRELFGSDEIDTPPWYAYVLGVSGILFAVGTFLVGVAGRRAGRLAIAAVLAGATFPLALGLGDTAGHVVWLTPWLVLAIGLARASKPAAVDARASVVVG